MFHNEGEYNDAMNAEAEQAQEFKATHRWENGRNYKELVCIVSKDGDLFTVVNEHGDKWAAAGESLRFIEPIEPETVAGWKPTHRLNNGPHQTDVVLLEHGVCTSLVAFRNGDKRRVYNDDIELLEPEPQTVTGPEAWELLERGAVLKCIQTPGTRGNPCLYAFYRMEAGKIFTKRDLADFESHSVRRDIEVSTWTIVEPPREPVKWVELYPTVAEDELFEPPKPDSAFLKALKRECDEAAKALDKSNANAIARTVWGDVPDTPEGYHLKVRPEVSEVGSLAWAVEELKAGRETVRLRNGTLSFHRLVASNVVRTDYEIGGDPTEFDLGNWVKIMRMAQPHGWTSRPRTDDSRDSGDAATRKDAGHGAEQLDARRLTTPQSRGHLGIGDAEPKRCEGMCKGNGVTGPELGYCYDCGGTGYSFDVRGYMVAKWPKAPGGLITGIDYATGKHPCRVCGADCNSQLCSVHLAAWELVDTPLHRARDFEGWCRRERLKGQVEACKASKEGA